MDTKILKSIIICLSIFLLQSCAVSLKKQAKYFDVKFKNQNTGLDKVIDINGYYTDAVTDSDYLHGSILFYPNGIFFVFVGYFGSPQKEDIRSYLLQENDYNKLKTNFNYDGYQPAWGCYRIQEDTIVTQVITLNDWWAGGVQGETVIYKIIDKNTIRKIRSDNFTYESKTDKEINENNMKTANFPLLHFSALEYIPNPNKSWILQEKWFWKNEADWIEYMESIGKKVKIPR